ncbi:MAG: protein kinase [Bdellovibrionales bacterium]
MAGHYEHFGKYILLEKLATGGMAEVFLARGTGAGGIGKFFAIKRILPQYADSPEFIEMFKDEAKIAINLSHSNIVSIHEFGVEKGQFFLVMDYVEGRNLRQILNKMKKTSVQFSIDQIVYVIKEVASGLDHAHRCIDGTTGKPLNITHRDMSPQNIMVSFEGEVKIVDFGIAKAESQIESTRAGTLKGKFGYMSPEQAEGQPVDLRTDVFSLGIVLWELLANDRLFVANNEINTLRKIRDCQIPSLRKINPNIHTELERIVQKALARDRNLRYQTGAALQRDLNRFLNRQYPDFSAQDYAVFIKSVFADEILSLRKRLVEYSKVNLTVNLTLNTSVTRAEPTSTELLNTNTDSVVVTGSDISESGQGVNIITNASDPNGTATTPVSSTSSHQTLPTASLQSGHGLRIEDTRAAFAAPDQHTQGTATEPIDPNAPMPRAGVGVLDDEALKNAIFRHEATNSRVQPIEIKAGDVLKAPDLNVPQPPPDTSGPPMPRIAMRNTSTRIKPLSPEKRRPVQVATALIFFLFCLSGYSYLAKYHHSTCGLTETLDPLLSPLHSALGIPHSCDPKVSGDPNINPVKCPGPNCPHPTPTPTPGTTETDEFDINVEKGLVVTSNPSGAEIYYNEQPTGMVTPSRLNVSGTFTIAVKKKGYLEFKVRDVTSNAVGSRLDATLQKLNVAYLDIEIFPPQAALVFVNGQEVQFPPRSPVVREIPIPGNTPVKVRAEAVNSNTYEEVIVNIPTDKRKVVQLNPRKTSRSPSSRR